MWFRWWINATTGLKGLIRTSKLWSQCWVTVGPPSMTAAQHQPSIDSTSRVFRVLRDCHKSGELPAIINGVGWHGRLAASRGLCCACRSFVFWIIHSYFPGQRSLRCARNLIASDNEDWSRIEKRDAESVVLNTFVVDPSDFLRGSHGGGGGLRLVYGVVYSWMGYLKLSII